MTARDAQQAQAQLLERALRDNLSLRGIARWSSPGGGLRGGNHAPADTRPEREEHRNPAEHYVDVSGRHRDERYPGWQSENADMARPGERVSVYDSKTNFVRLPDGSLQRFEHGFASENAFARGELVLSSPSSSMEAAALSFMTKHPRDIGWRMLLLMYAEDESQLEEILVFGWAYLLHWDDRMRERNPRRKMRGVDAVLDAGCDAVDRMFFGRNRHPARDLCQRSAYSAKSYSLEDRVKPWVSRDVVAELRNVCTNALERRLHRARLAYLHALRGTEDHTFESLYSRLKGSSQVSDPDQELEISKRAA